MTRLRPRARRWMAPIALLAALSLSSFVSNVAHAETLTADEAVSRAAAQSPTLRASLLDLAAAQHAVAAEKGAREPTLIASVTGERAESLSVGSVAGRSTSTSVGSSVALRYTTDVGTSLEAGVSGDTSWRSATSSSTSSATSSGPTYGGSAYVTARQPLLRGAGTDAVLAPYAQARASATAADKQREVTASQTALEVLRAYWELWYADQAVGVQEAALKAAQQQVADAKTRAEMLGTGTKVDVLQFSTSAASIADSLSQARASRATKAIELGRTLGMEPAESTSLRATGEPPASGEIPSAEAVTRAVTERSSELAAARAELEGTRSRVAAAEDADQPRLDLFTTVSAGTAWANDDLLGLSLPGGRPAISVLGGLELELPFGGGRASSDAARARAQESAAKARYQARLDAIEAEASSMRESLKAVGDQVTLASETARMAGELAEAERQRMVLGTTTSSEVVKAEQTRREAELRKLRAMVTQATSRFQLEHATGALLDRFASVFQGSSS